MDDRGAGRPGSFWLEWSSESWAWSRRGSTARRSRCAGRTYIRQVGGEAAAGREVLESFAAGDAGDRGWLVGDGVRPPDRFHPPHLQRPHRGAAALGEQFDAVAGGAWEHLVGDHALSLVG